jgi:hypothetical protein
MRAQLTVVTILIVAAATGGWVPPAGIGAPGQRSSVEQTEPHRTAEQARNEAEVLTLDQKIANAVVHGDTSYVSSVTSSDFVMVHGDGWTKGGKPLSVDTKDSMLSRVNSKYYDVLDFDSVMAEMHGNIAITYGRYIAHRAVGDPNTAWFSVWFERVYAKRDGRWIYLSHRTVHGPTYGAERRAVAD